MAISDSLTDLVKPEDIIRNISQLLDDGKFRRGLTTGWYKQQLRDAFDEISFSAKQNVLWMDIDLSTAKNGKLELPKGIIDLKEVYVFNDDDCGNITGVSRVWWKRRYNNQPTGQGYTAHITEFENDFENWFQNPVPYLFGLQFQTLNWGNVQNGIIMLNPNALNKNKIRFVYAGTMGDYATIPCVPRYMVKFCQDWLTYKGAQAMAIRFPREGYARLYQQAFDELYNSREPSYYNVKKRVGEMSTFENDSNDVMDERGNW